MEEQIRNSTELHGYLVGKFLGRGSFGVVYLVTKKRTHENFFLKVIKLGNQPAFDQAKQDAKLARH
ncbi:hypothetical protein EON65_47025 [archaeon]|nr:MAG: hypothetical protein EON65_47025 [archaeon]